MAMEGYVESWIKSLGTGKIAECPEPGDSYPFDDDGFCDPELQAALKNQPSFNDTGPCPGRLQVSFVTDDGGRATCIRRLRAQVSWKEF